MNQNTNKTSNPGFTLVELMVSLAIFGLVMVGIFGVYLSTQRSTNTQEQVVDLQQNLRVGLESISRDLRWAGFLIGSTANPIANAGTNTVTINTISGSRKVAQIATGFDSPSAISTIKTITLKEPIDLKIGDLVRIIRPANASQPVPRVLLLTSDSSSTSLSIKGFNSAQVFNEGDIVAEYVGSATPSDLNPNTITYSLIATTGSPIGTNDLIRNSGTGNEIVASGITSLTFSYLLDAGTEPADPSTITDLGDIRAVRVTLEGGAASISGTKNRAMTSLVALRNRN